MATPKTSERLEIINKLERQGKETIIDKSIFQPNEEDINGVLQRIKKARIMGIIESQKHESVTTEGGVIVDFTPSINRTIEFIIIED